MILYLCISMCFLRLHNHHHHYRRRRHHCHCYLHIFATAIFIILPFIQSLYFCVAIMTTDLQLLLVQDGKLYGRDPFYDVISRAIALPDVIRNQELEKNEFVVQLGQVSINILSHGLCIWFAPCLDLLC